jgi:DegV family protein with EDD domain
MSMQARPVKIVTDSAADLPPALIRDFDIAVIPLLIMIEGREYREGVDLSNEELYQRAATARGGASTAFPAPEVFAQVYRRLTGAGYDVVSVHLAAVLSGIVGAATFAARGEDVPPDRVRVVDSRTGTLAQGWVVVAAAEAAARGLGLAEVAAAAEDAAGRSFLYGGVATLEYLIRKGRIGMIPGTVGTLLNIKPIVSVRPTGEVFVLERVRTEHKLLERLGTLTAAAGPIERVGVIHAADPQAAQTLLALLEPLPVPRPIPVTPMGAVLGTSVGPGAVGVCGLKRQGSAPV